MHHQRKNTDASTAVHHRAISVLFTSFFFMSIIFSACDQVQRVVSTAKMDAPIKIGLLYSSIGYSGAAVLSRYDENRHPIKSGVINIIKDGEIQLHQVFEP